MERVAIIGPAAAGPAEGSLEGFDLPLLRWIWRYPWPRVLRILAGLEGRADVHRLRSPAEVRRYLGALESGAPTSRWRQA